MPRALGLRDDDILGRLADLERRMDEGETSRMTKAEREARDEFERNRLREEYPVQMRAPGVFPDDSEKVPASETEAVIDSIRAKTMGDLRHATPINPMDAPPTDQLAGEARARAIADAAAEQKLLGIDPESQAKRDAEGAREGRPDVDADDPTAIAKIEGAQRGDQPAAEIAAIRETITAPAGKEDSQGSPPATGGAEPKSESRSDSKSSAKGKSSSKAKE